MIIYLSIYLSIYLLIPSFVLVFISAYADHTGGSLAGDKNLAFSATEVVTETYGFLDIQFVYLSARQTRPILKPMELGVVPIDSEFSWQSTEQKKFFSKKPCGSVIQ